jgi:hypothetical protein
LPERTAAEFIDYGVTSLEKLKFASFQCLAWKGCEHH